MPTCQIPNCDRPLKAFQLCETHYMRLRRTGTTDTPIRSLPITERFWVKVHKTETCWLWTASVNAHGYGDFRLKSKMVRAHRFSYFLAHGRWPQPECLHSCDNPLCVRPDHLREGTHQDNMADMVARKRAKSGGVYGSQCGAAKLTETNVRNIKELLSKNVSRKEIRQMFGLSHGMLSDIVLNKTWRHVTI